VPWGWVPRPWALNITDDKGGKVGGWRGGGIGPALSTHFVAGAAVPRPCLVSNSRPVERCVRLSRPPLSCQLRSKGYVTYRARSSSTAWTLTHPVPRGRTRSKASLCTTRLWPAGTPSTPTGPSDRSSLIRPSRRCSQRRTIPVGLALGRSVAQKVIDQVQRDEVP
jgi:hypothetical protein